MKKLIIVLLMILCSSIAFAESNERFGFKIKYIGTTNTSADIEKTTQVIGHFEVPIGWKLHSFTSAKDQDRYDYTNHYVVFIKDMDKKEKKVIEKSNPVVTDDSFLKHHGME